jgi:hypothetical protein
LFISFDINLKSIFNHYFLNLGHTVFVPQYLKTAQAVLVHYHLTIIVYLNKENLLRSVLHVHLIKKQPQVQNEAADGSGATSANTARIRI